MSARRIKTISKHRRAARVDTNQPDIVTALRKIPGVSVETGHDDIMVGYKGKTYWFEIKEPWTVSKITGQVQPSRIQPSQKDLLAEWKGHYQIVWDIDQIIKTIF